VRTTYSSFEGVSTFMYSRADVSVRDVMDDSALSARNIIPFLILERREATYDETAM